MLRSDAVLFYADNPIYFVEDVIRAKPDERQGDILGSLRDYSMTSVRSGHNIGRSIVEVWSVIWYMCTRPFPKIPYTAPTEHQLTDVLWAEISKWMRDNPALRDDLIWTREEPYMQDHPEEWFAVPRAATNPEALQGFHAKHVLYIIDGASGVSDKVFEPVLGAMTGEDAKLLMMGNSTRLAGFFYDSHHRNREQYSAIHVDGRNSQYVPRIFIQKIIDIFGEDSDVSRVRIAGQSPKSAPDSLITMEWREEAVNLQIYTPGGQIDIDVDVAHYGDDSSALYPLVDKRQSLPCELCRHNRITEIAGYVVIIIKQFIMDHSDAAIQVKVDRDGLGIGVYDGLYDQRDQIIDTIWYD